VGDRADGVSQPQVVEHPERVGPELDTSSNLAELRRLLEHGHRMAVLCEGARRRQASMPPPTTRSGDRTVTGFIFRTSSAHVRSHSLATVRRNSSLRASSQAVGFPSPSFLGSSAMGALG
jgi:hypothetical protein